jgi:c-di-GMP-binding flagellar brake protein YcgR
MRIRRQYIRIKSHSACILIGLDGHPYEALLDNLSLNGALIKVKNGVPNSVHVGDNCGLMLFNVQNVHPERRSCRVVRHDLINVGVKFLGHKFH